MTLMILALSAGYSTPTIAVNSNLARNWEIHLLVPGGLAGVYRELHINHHGEWIASDKKANLQRSGQQIAKKLDSAGLLVADATITIRTIASEPGFKRELVSQATNIRV